MDWIFIILTVVAGYFVLAFVVFRLIVPFMGFKPYQVPKELPEEVRLKIKELEAQSQDQDEYLLKAFQFVISRWYAVRYKAVTELHKLFRSDMEKIWHETGYAHCSTQNFILHALLVGSRFYKPEDVRVRHVFLNFVPHQYMEVKVAGKWIDVDPAAVSSGITVFGKHGEGLG